VPSAPRVSKTKGTSRAWQLPSRPLEERRGPGELVDVDQLAPGSPCLGQAEAGDAEVLAAGSMGRLTPIFSSGAQPSSPPPPVHAPREDLSTQLLIGHDHQLAAAIRDSIRSAIG
jgi:hypothetical protein